MSHSHSSPLLKNYRKRTHMYKNIYNRTPKHIVVYLHHLRYTISKISNVTPIDQCHFAFFYFHFANIYPCKFGVYLLKSWTLPSLQRPIERNISKIDFSYLDLVNLLFIPTAIFLRYSPKSAFRIFRWTNFDLSYIVFIVIMMLFGRE